MDWYEIAEWLLRNRRDMFSPDCLRADDIMAALDDAWGEDRAAAVWKLEDVMNYAEKNGDEITECDGREAMQRLVSHLCGATAYDILDDILFEISGGYDNYDDTDY